MRFTNTFSVLVAYALFAAANASPINNDLEAALARLDSVKYMVHNAAVSKGAKVSRQSAGKIAADITKIVSDSIAIGTDSAQLVADLQSDPSFASEPNAAAITADALKVASDATTLGGDIAKLASDAASLP